DQRHVGPDEHLDVVRLPPPRIDAFAIVLPQPRPVRQADVRVPVHVEEDVGRVVTPDLGKPLPVVGGVRGEVRVERVHDLAAIGLGAAIEHDVIRHGRSPRHDPYRVRLYSYSSRSPLPTRSSGRSGGRVLFSFACVARAALSVQRSSSVSRSGSATPWKISNCSQPGSFRASAHRALYACASSEPLPGTAVIVTTSRIDMGISFGRVSSSALFERRLP